VLYPSPSIVTQGMKKGGTSRSLEVEEESTLHGMIGTVPIHNHICSRFCGDHRRSCRSDGQEEVRKATRRRGPLIWVKKSRCYNSNGCMFMCVAGIFFLICFL